MVVHETRLAKFLIRTHLPVGSHDGDVHDDLPSQGRSVRSRDAVTLHRDARANAPQCSTSSGRLRAGAG
jgi:hypothetical protein